MPISPNLPITITPRPTPRPMVTTIPASTTPTVLPVACGYARCSAPDQDSLPNQITHLEQVIRANPLCRIADTPVYFDDGISGRDAIHRPGLQAMLADCRDGLIQMIYFKSVSRLARNVTDLLSIVRELTAIGVILIFEKENIRTDQMASDFLLSTMAIIAEFESSNIGSSVRWGHVSKFARGTHKVVHAPYGYDKDPAGSLVINPSEAAIVREIFDRICAGEGCGRIAKDLEARHVPTKRGGRWESGTIRSIIKNPAVMGTMVGQRYYIQDSKAHVNRGEKDMYIREEHHAPIITAEQYECVQDILGFRRQKYNTFCFEEDEDNAMYRLQRSCFSSHIFCACCGSTLQRGGQISSGPDLDPVTGKEGVWRCSQRTKDPTICSMTAVREGDLKRAFINLVNKLLYSQTTDLPLLDLYIASQQGDDEDRNAAVLQQLSDELQKIEYERTSVNELSGRNAIAPAAFREKMNSLQRRENEIKQAQVKLQKSHSVREVEKLKKLLSSARASEPFSSSNLSVSPGEGCTVLNGQTSRIDRLAPLSGKNGTPSDEQNRYQFSFDEVLFEAIVECVVVHSKQYITFELKCGLRLTEYFADPVLCAENMTLPPDSLSVYTSRLLTEPRITSPYDPLPTAGSLSDKSEIEGTFAATEHSERAAFPQQEKKQSRSTDPCSLPYGYRWNGEGMAVSPEEAERLRTFFHLLSEGVTVADAGIAAGIPLKLPALRKLASRRAYGGRNKLPPIVASSLINIKTTDNRRAPFVPMYTEFEYGIVPEMGGGLPPAEYINALYQEIRPVEVYQKGVAEFPRKEMSAPSMPFAQSSPAASATTSTTSALSTPLTSIAPGTATTPTPSASIATEAPATPTPSASIATETLATPAGETASLLPSDKTSGKRRIVDLAIDAHNEKARTAASGPSITTTTVSRTTTSNASSLPPKPRVVKTEIEGGDEPQAAQIDILVSVSQR